MTPELKMNINELNEVIADFPRESMGLEILDVRPMEITIRLPIDPSHLRFGDTVSGPTMFLLADCAFYLATLAMIGKKLLTVTTNANINFMRRPRGNWLVARATVLKLGKHLSVGDVQMYSDQEPDLCVAHATMTYSIPRDGIA